MPAAIDRPGTSGLWFNLAVPVAAVLIGNALIFALGAGGASDLSPSQERFIPPGAVVGMVWVVQFALLGLSRWFYLRGSGDHGPASWLPGVLALMGLAFPVYTGLFTDSAVGAAGTLATLAATVAVMLVLDRKSHAAARTLLPLAGWLGYVACVYLLA